MKQTKWFMRGAMLVPFFLFALNVSAQQPVNCAGMNPPMQNIAGVCVPTTQTTGLSSKTVSEILINFMNWILGIFGVIAIIGFVISGLQYLLATGDEGTAETAKRNMKYCIIGVIVALAAFVILQAIDKILNASVIF